MAVPAIPLQEERGPSASKAPEAPVPQDSGPSIQSLLLLILSPRSKSQASSYLVQWELWSFSQMEPKSNLGAPLGKLLNLPEVPGRPSGRTLTLPETQKQE